MFKEQAKMFGIDPSLLLKGCATKEDMIEVLKNAIQKRMNGECSNGFHCGERYDVKTVDVNDFDSMISLVAQGYEKQFEINAKIILRKQI